MLAESNEGYRNLIKVASNAYLDGYYYKPRVDFELLELACGLIAATGCLGGAVLKPCSPTTTPARDDAARFQSIFGRDSFFVELQDHGLPEQSASTRSSSSRARPPVPLLATNDSHYTHDTTPNRTPHCSACRRAPPSTTRSASSSTPTSST